jgi:hypothetical protein
MLIDSTETYRNEFAISGINGVFTAWLAGRALVATDSIEKCKQVIDTDYPVNVKSAYYEQMDFDDNSSGPILGYEDDDSDLRHNNP